MKIRKKKKDVNQPKQEKEDWDADFDFSIYDTEQEEEQIQSLSAYKRPRITGLKSRFSNGQAEMERIAEINKLISKYSIEVASKTQDSPLLWKYYAILDEFWESMRNIYGSIINEEIEGLQKDCMKLLETYKEGKIPYKVHKRLLLLRSYLYRLKQMANLGIEVERTSRGSWSKVKDQITQ